MEIIFTERFVSDLEASIAYIAQDDPQTAISWSNLILERCEQLVDFPMSGRIVPEVGLPYIRELIEGNYRIVYEIKENQIVMLMVWNSRQQLPSKPL